MRRALIVAAAALLAAPAAAQAHVTLQPNEAPAGGFTRLNVRVPNERDSASTTKIDLQLPPGFADASYEPVAGWTVKVTKTKLAQPIKTDDGEITEGVSQITWTADGAKDGIPPGAFRDFGLSVRIPGKAGDKLTFKALQTYSNGEIVRWIGPEGSDNPAPIVSVTGDEPAAAAATPAATATPAASDDSGGSDALAITALIVGVLGLLTAVVALIGTRRRAKVS
jgi:uncharacterized protein